MKMKAWRVWLHHFIRVVLQRKSKAGHVIAILQDKHYNEILKFLAAGLFIQFCWRGKRSLV